MFSVVPREIDAQPTHGSAIAATASSLIMMHFPQPFRPSRNLGLKASRGPYGCFDIVNRGDFQSLLRRTEVLYRGRPSLFEPIRGIVRLTDSRIELARNT
jgi:hypothetical protein